MNRFETMHHACAFFSSSVEQDRVLAEFIGEGIERGHRAIHTVAPHRCSEHVTRLTTAGIDISAARDNGRFRMQDWNVTHLPDGVFKPERTLACFKHQVDEARGDGFSNVRFVTHMEWALEAVPAVDSLLEYEALANDAWMRQRKPASSVICVYDSSRFGADLLVDVLRTHPFTIVDGLVQENPYFVPPDAFLNELRARRSGAPVGGLAPWQMRRIKALLAANGEASPSVGRLAEECGLSLRHFTRAFQRSTGLPPHRWVLRRRVEMARQLLRDPARSLLDVALTCGFTDQSHFTRTFTADVGCSPSRWRRTLI